VLLPGLRSALLLGSSALVAGTLTLSGCHGSQHPDQRMAVYNALDQSNLRSVTVSQDRGAGTITLSGIIGSMDRRAQAERVAKQAAPGYQIVDRIQIESAGLQGEIKSATQTAQLDSAIEDKYKATLASDHTLKSQQIQYSAYKGTLTLKGTVRTAQERQEAEDLAKQVPEVQHVDNQIRVKGGKPSPANS
jgi:osmotically-inducible protein OsmY